MGGEWIPQKKETLPVKIYKEKRKGSFVTLIKHLPFEGKELKDFVSEIKKVLATGGALKGDVLEIQGDKERLVYDFIQSKGIKVSKLAAR